MCFYVDENTIYKESLTKPITVNKRLSLSYTAFGNLILEATFYNFVYFTATDEAVKQHEIKHINLKVVSYNSYNEIHEGYHANLRRQTAPYEYNELVQKLSDRFICSLPVICMIPYGSEAYINIEEDEVVASDIKLEKAVYIRDNKIIHERIESFMMKLFEDIKQQKRRTNNVFRVR